MQNNTIEYRKALNSEVENLAELRIQMLCENKYFPKFERLYTQKQIIGTSGLLQKPMIPCIKKQCISRIR